MIRAEDFDKKIIEFKQNVANEMPIVNTKVSLAILGDVRRRILTSGTNAQGQQLGQYSEVELPAFFFTHQKQTKSASKKREKSDKISYKDWRGMNNLETGFVNLSFTGETLKDFAVMQESAGNGYFTTLIASKNSATRTTFSKGEASGSISTGEIAEKLFDKYGDFMEPSQEEEEVAAQILDKYWQEILDKTFEV